MDALSEQFLAWAEFDRLRSPHTVARYRAVLNMIPNAATADIEQIEAWWSTRLDKSAGTRANELACLRAFYKWMTRKDHRADDPSRRLDAPDVDNMDPQPITQTDLERLLRVAGELGALDMRRAIALGAYGGLRVTEAAALDWGHVDIEHKRLHIRGKGAKNRLSGISVVLLDLILPNTGGNVVTAGGKPYSGATLQRKVNRFIDRHDIDKTFHDLRKRYVTQSIAKTGNIHAVAKAVGWASIETANAYAALSDEALDLIAAAAV